MNGFLEIYKINGNFSFYTALFDYIKDNPEEFMNVDLSEWLLGKKLEF